MSSRNTLVVVLAVLLGPLRLRIKHPLSKQVKRILKLQLCKSEKVLNPGIAQGARWWILVPS